VPFPAVLTATEFVTLELFRGLAQRNKGARQAILTALPGPKCGGRTPEAEARSFFSSSSFSASSIFAAVS